MSLLEDVFLQDEAGEAQELERVIEGDEFEERVRSDSDDNSEKEDEAEEDKRRVDPNSTKTRRVTKNPRFTLNPARLSGPRGIQVIPDHFKDFKFKGKGHEKEDLDLVLKKLEHWAYRLYPKFKFEDCLKKIETLGKKRPVMVHLHKIRTDQYISEETVVQKDSSNEEDEKEPEDEFDKLLQQQIELARSTPAPSSVRKNIDSAVKENRPLSTPIATSSPTINNEQRERMLRNRKLAEERRLARIQNANNSMPNKNDIILNNETGNTDDNNLNSVKKNSRSNIIDSSDDEITTINTSITVDVHKNIINKEKDQNDSKSNEDNSNNVLQMDTDSDTEIQNDNSNTVTLINNDENVIQIQSNVNDNEHNDARSCDKSTIDSEQNNDKTQSNNIEIDLVSSKNNEIVNIDHDFTDINLVKENTNDDKTDDRGGNNDKIQANDTEVVLDSTKNYELVNNDVEFNDTNLLRENIKESNEPLNIEEASKLKEEVLHKESKSKKITQFKKKLLLKN